MALPLVARASRRSSAEIGLAYENHSLAYLNTQLHMSLRRVGRAGDGGIDVRGSWWVPQGAAPTSALRRAGFLEAGGPASESGARQQGIGMREEARRIRAVGQCKAERKPLGPRVVRELEGVVAGVQYRQRQSRSPSPVSLADSLDSPGSSERLDTDPDGTDHPPVSDTDDIIGILLSQSGFSKSSMQHASRSGTPLMLIHLLGGHPHEAEAATEELLEGTRSEDGVAVRDLLPDYNQQADVVGEDQPFKGQVESIWWNSALSGPQGVLGGKVEIKREMVLDQAVRAVRKAAGGLDSTGGIGVKAGARAGAGVGLRWGLWYGGRRMERMGPDADT